MNGSTPKKAITYKQTMSQSDFFRYLKAVGVPLSIFVLSLFAIQSLAGFGSKLVAPLTGVMWATGAICAIIMGSHRGSILTETHVTIAGYLAALLALKEVIALMSGVSSEMLMAAFNQAIPVTSGSAISGWLQNMMWIAAVMTPIGFIGMQVKRVFTFRREKSAQKTFDEIRGIRPGMAEHQK